MSTEMIAFLSPCPSPAWRKRRSFSHAVRCSVTSSDEGEPHFINAIRTATKAALAERGLAISDIQWSDRCLRVYVSTRADIDGQPDADGATSDECHYASSVLGDLLDEDISLAPSEEYTLEVSSPGTRDVLTKDREFEAFKGFQIRVATTEFFKKKSVFEGTLHGRTKDKVMVNVKGRIVAIPRHIVADVKLQAALEE